MITIPKNAVDLMRIEALAAFPAECCGLLVGHEAGDDAYVTRMVPSENILAGAGNDRFEIDPGVRLRLQRELRGTNEDIIGFYHSHPNGSAVPSATDLANVHEPSLIWIIVAVDGTSIADMKAYRPAADASRFDALALEMVD